MASTNSNKPPEQNQQPPAPPPAPAQDDQAQGQAQNATQAPQAAQVVVVERPKTQPIVIPQITTTKGENGTITAHVGGDPDAK